MATNFFKNKSKKKEELRVPRKLDEITKEYSETAIKAGGIQYQIFALERDLKSFNEAMLSLNYEAAERKRLDKEIEEKNQAEVKNEQV